MQGSASLPRLPLQSGSQRGIQSRRDTRRTARSNAGKSKAASSALSVPNQVFHAETAAVNQAKLAHQFIGEEDHHMEHISMGKMSGRQHKKSNQKSNHLKTGMDDNEFLKKQLNSARRAQMQDGNAFSKIPAEFRKLIDIDGDGTVDQEEYKLMEELENVVGEDVDGDGIVDDAEHRLAKIRAGRRLLAKKFVDKQGGRMYRFGPQFMDRTNEECTQMICKAKYFAGLMNDLKYQERQIRLSSSDQVGGLMKPPLSTRAQTGRYCDLSEMSAANISYKIPRRLQKSKKGVTAAEMQMARTREDILYSARKNMTTQHNHSRGEIKGYGSFTNYLDKTIQIYGSFNNMMK